MKQKLNERRTFEECCKEISKQNKLGKKLIHSNLFLYFEMAAEEFNKDYAFELTPADLIALLNYINANEPNTAYGKRATKKLHTELQKRLHKLKI
jgi:hypothetical protein